MRQGFLRGWTLAAGAVLLTAGVTLLAGGWSQPAPPAGAPLAAPRLGVAGAAFTIDGQPRFLLLVSYFDALRASDTALETDFAFFQAHGIAGVRVFPNWWRCEAEKACGGHPGDDTLVAAPDGRLRPERLVRLRHVLARAAAHRLVVDLSFARETVAPGPGDQRLSPQGHGEAIAATLAALGDGAAHVMVDVQNEGELNHLFSRVTAEDARAVGRLRRRLAAVHQPVFLSTGEADAEAYAYCGSPSACPPDAQRLDVLAVHDARRRDWAERTGSVVGALRDLARRRGLMPVYLQEPAAWQDEPGPGRVERYLAAAAAARAAGAAAWTFHTRSGFLLRDGRAMTSRLAADERDVLIRLRPRIDAAAR